MNARTLTDTTVAEAYLHILADRGVDYFFANAGTDFAPLIEAFAKGEALGYKFPKPITVPHENVAVSMALGHALVSGKPQAVMVHVNVGTANALCGLLNAQRAHVPMLFTAGRTPILEEGLPGARASFVHWSQEMFDQSGMVREAVKWDYELRYSNQLETVVDRALSIANSSPSGPVYLTLPREVLAKKLDSFTFETGSSRQRATVPPGPNVAALEEAARMLEKARNPLIVTSTLGRTAEAVAALSDLALQQAIPVISYNPRSIDLPSSHPMNMGQDINAWLDKSDVVLVLETMVPWVPRETRPHMGAKVIHIGEDPLYERIPIRSFQCDLAITASPELALRQLAALLAQSIGRDPQAIEHRRARLAEKRLELDTSRLAAWEAVQSSAEITPLHISRAIDAIKGDALVFKESGLRIDHMCFDEPKTYFFSGAAGGLGWSLGAALGAQLAEPDRLVISTTGDGSYMFGTPLAAHFVAAEQKLPVLFVVFNNRGWHAVRRSTHGMYKQGYAADASKAGNEPLTDFSVDLSFEKMMDVVGGYGEKVEDIAQLPKALDRALDVIRTEKRQVLLNVMCTT